MTTGKIPLTIWTFVGKVMSLLFIGVWYIKHRSWLKKKKDLGERTVLTPRFAAQNTQAVLIELNIIQPVFLRSIVSYNLTSIVYVVFEFFFSVLLDFVVLFV